MGNTYSKVIETESMQWSRDHELRVQEDRARACIALIDAHLIDGEWMQMKTRGVQSSGVVYYHYYICTKRSPEWVLEFGGGSITNNTVVFHNNPPTDGEILVESEFPLERDVKERMKRVVGATNYSLALRNCEHVARYVYSGAWICNQMTGEEVGLGGIFLKALMRTEHKQKLNQLPLELKEELEPKVIIDGLAPIVTYRKGVAEISEDAHNILVIGPTGCGKSQFINRLFNMTVCPVGGTADSVTRQLDTYQGRITFLSGKEKKANVIDSVGFCDSTLSANVVFAITKRYLRDRVQYLDKVVVIVSDRIIPAHVEAIRQILDWLRFSKTFSKNKGNYLFIYNKADKCTLAEKQKNVAIMAQRLKTGNVRVADGTRNVPMNVPLGIPPDAPSLAVKEQLDTIRTQLEGLYEMGKPQRISVSPEFCVIL